MLSEANSPLRSVDKDPMLLFGRRRQLVACDLTPARAWSRAYRRGSLAKVPRGRGRIAEGASPPLIGPFGRPFRLEGQARQVGVHLVLPVGPVVAAVGAPVVHRVGDAPAPQDLREPVRRSRVLVGSGA